MRARVYKTAAEKQKAYRDRKRNASRPITAQIAEPTSNARSSGTLPDDRWSSLGKINGQELFMLWVVIGDPRPIPKDPRIAAVAYVRPL